MRNWWFKCDTSFWCSPRILHLRKACGRSELRWRRAASVYQAVLGLNAEGRCDGHLRAQYADSELIAMRAGLSDREVRSAFDDLTRAGLIASRKGVQELRICGWDETWKTPASGAERTEAWRERRKAGGKKR